MHLLHGSEERHLVANVEVELAGRDEVDDAFVYGRVIGDLTLEHERSVEATCGLTVKGGGEEARRVEHLAVHLCNGEPDRQVALAVDDQGQRLDLVEELSRRHIPRGPTGDRVGGVAHTTKRSNAVGGPPSGGRREQREAERGRKDDDEEPSTATDVRRTRRASMMTALMVLSVYVFARRRQGYPHLAGELTTPTDQPNPQNSRLLP